MKRIGLVLLVVALAIIGVAVVMQGNDGDVPQPVASKDVPQVRLIRVQTDDEAQRKEQEKLKALAYLQRMDPVRLDEEVQESLRDPVFQKRARRKMIPLVSHTMGVISFFGEGPLGPDVVVAAQRRGGKVTVELETPSRTRFIAVGDDLDSLKLEKVVAHAAHHEGIDAHRFSREQVGETMRSLEALPPSIFEGTNEVFVTFGSDEVFEVVRGVAEELRLPTEHLSVEDVKIERTKYQKRPKQLQLAGKPPPGKEMPDRARERKAMQAETFITATLPYSDAKDLRVDLRPEKVDGKVRLSVVLLYRVS